MIKITPKSIELFERVRVRIIELTDEGKLAGDEACLLQLSLGLAIGVSVRVRDEAKKESGE